MGFVSFRGLYPACYLYERDRVSAKSLVLLDVLLCILSLLVWLSSLSLSSSSALLWPDYSKYGGGQFIRTGLNIEKKCWLYVNNFSCVKIYVFRSFFAFRPKTHVRCDNQYKPGAERGNILGQPIVFECMGICVLSPAHESEMRGYLVYALIVKYIFH